MCFLCFRNTNSPAQKHTYPPGVQVFEFPDQILRPASPIECLPIMEQFEKLIAKIQPDVIQAGPVQLCGLMVALSGFRPFLIVSWGSDVLIDAFRDAQWRWATTHALRSSTRLLCDCETVQSRVQEFISYPTDRVVQFPWGVDLNAFAPSEVASNLRLQLGWHDKYIFLSTRSWEPIYDILTALRAFKQAYSQNPSLRLILVGTGSQSNEIKAFLEVESLTSVVHCPGPIDNSDLPAYFRAANTYLSCSLSDGSSISLIEALATGLPVIVSDIPSNREWVKEGINGWLAPVTDVQGFANAMLSASEATIETRSTIGRRNRVVAECRANWNQNFALLITAYDQIKHEYFR
jgi:L-malate glycosyltransferase